MREINDQYPEYAPPTEKLKGRKHRKSGVNALPLCVCAFFIAACFIAPLRSVSGSPESGPLPAGLSAEKKPETEKASEESTDLSETEPSETAEVRETITEPAKETAEESLPGETESTAAEAETLPETSAGTHETLPQTTAEPRETIPVRPQETAAPPVETLPVPSASAPESVPETVLQPAETAAETGAPVPESIQQEETDITQESQSESESFTEPESDFGAPLLETESTEEPSGESMTAETSGTDGAADYDPTGRPAPRESDTSGETPSESVRDTEHVTGTTEADAAGASVPDTAAADPDAAGYVSTALETEAAAAPAEEEDIPAPAEFETEPVVWDDVP